MTIIKKWWKPTMVLLVAAICFVFSCSVFVLAPAETEELYKDVASKFIESKDFSLVPYGSVLTINNTDGVVGLEHTKSGAVLKAFYNSTPLEYAWNDNTFSIWSWRIILTLFMTFLISVAIHGIVELAILFKEDFIKRREEKIIKKDGDAYPVGFELGYQDGFNKGRSKGYHKGIKDFKNEEYERGLEDGAEKAFAEINDFDDSEENASE